MISVNAVLPFLALSYACDPRRSCIVDTLSDKETAKRLFITIATLVVVMLAFILAANIV